MSRARVVKRLAACSAAAVILAVGVYAASGRSIREDGATVRSSVALVAGIQQMTELPRGRLWNKRQAPTFAKDCDGSEELYLGLCYTKCAILTDGAHPFRSTAFTCCETEACGVNIFKMETSSIVPCGGFDTSNTDGNIGCPHAPGECLTNEEQYGGLCYEKCGVLTNGFYPNRVAVATCCKIDGIACLNPLKDWTARQINVGGGAWDHDPQTSRAVHRPRKSLTVAKPATPPPTAPANIRRVPTVSATPVLYDWHMHDGNRCDNSEELFMGLCYTKCFQLTNGRYSTRKSAFTCCEKPDCGVNIFKMKTSSLIPCTGYDVSSADGGTACPHAAGTCLADEEQFGGECFEKCSTLTNGSYPNRVAAATCCKAEGVSCLNPLEDRTSMSFDVGGGAGDNDAQTPHQAHPPLTRLTEVA